MNARNHLSGAVLALLLIARPGIAQERVAANDGPKSTPAATAADSTEKKESSKRAAALLVPPLEIQHVRPNDQRGLNVFEAPKDDNVAWEGFKLSIGAGFAQQFQSLDHSNAALPKTAKDAAGKDYNANELMDIGWGVNLPTANLQVNAQLAPGIRVALESYLSSRHHQETWVKGGYVQIDQSPIDVPALNSLFKVLTIRAGMFPVSYGDAQFRRSDNGNVIYNPFVGNLILDAWTFEPGMEFLVRKNGVLAMAGITTGSNKGDVTAPAKRAPAFLGKLGFDRQLTPELRVRLTGSGYVENKTSAATLYAGDRAGSRYYLVMENTQATTNANFTSGLLNPGFSARVRGLQVNPFVKLGGLEFFGVAERGEGRGATETVNRTVTQYSGDLVYRFCHGEKLYVAGRYNTVSANLAGISNEVGIDRAALAAGWFVTPTILVKGEYVNQRYNDFPTTDLRSGGKFHGFVMEGAVSF